MNDDTMSLATTSYRQQSVGIALSPNEVAKISTLEFRGGIRALLSTNDGAEASNLSTPARCNKSGTPANKDKRKAPLSSEVRSPSRSVAWVPVVMQLTHRTVVVAIETSRKSVCTLERSWLRDSLAKVDEHTVIIPVAKKDGDDLQFLSVQFDSPEKLDFFFRLLRSPSECTSGVTAPTWVERELAVERTHDALDQLHSNAARAATVNFERDLERRQRRRDALFRQQQTRMQDLNIRSQFEELQKQAAARSRNAAEARLDEDRWTSLAEAQRRRDEAAENLYSELLFSGASPRVAANYEPLSPHALQSMYETTVAAARRVDAAPIDSNRAEGASSTLGGAAGDRRQHIFEEIRKALSEETLGDRNTRSASPAATARRNQRMALLSNVRLLLQEHVKDAQAARSAAAAKEPHEVQANTSESANALPIDYPEHATTAVPEKLQEDEAVRNSSLQRDAVVSLQNDTPPQEVGGQQERNKNGEPDSVAAEEHKTVLSDVSINAVNDGSTSAEAAQTNNEKQPAKPRPSEWKELKDPKGRTYYLNTITKKTTWNVNETSLVSGGAETKKVSGEAKVVPTEWKEMKDEKGRTYYLNTTTKKTTWRIEDTKEKQPAEPRPSEWKELKDPKGRTYYLNTITKKTTWNINETSLVSSGEATEWKEMKDEKGRTYYLNTTTKKTTWRIEDTKEKQPAEPRPSEWKELKDPKGRTYYLNTITKKTTWNINETLT